jgi:hypothetical protein
MWNGTAEEPEVNGHLAATACSLSPDASDDAECIEHWCAPPFRQQAGSFAPVGPENTGAISNQLNRTAKAVATPRYIASSVAQKRRVSVCGLGSAAPLHHGEDSFGYLVRPFQLQPMPRVFQTRVLSPNAAADPSLAFIELSLRRGCCR